MMRPPGRGGSHLRSLSFRVRVSDAQTLAQNLDSLVRVSRRAADDHYASILAPRGAVLGPRRAHFGRGCNTPGGATFPGPLSARGGRCWPGRGGVRRRERRVIRRARVW